MKFKIEKKLTGTLGRAGVIETEPGVIETPAFVVVGTKAAVKSVTPEQVRDLGGQIVLANTYHLYLQPGDEIIKKAGGLGKFMNWPAPTGGGNGPTMTDSGGFQVFSLGAAFGEKISKISTSPRLSPKEMGSLAKIDDDGVTFRSHLDGNEHRFTPERSIQIQHNIGADIIFAFDECTSPLAPYDYQKEAMARTHRWAERSLAEHRRLGGGQALLGIVQGGQYQELRKKSAKFISQLDFDGFGIGGSFTEDDIGTAVAWVNRILPEEKPRHLLGIGEPPDLFMGVEQGIDTFDCVIPTRMARHGQLFTKQGKINILNAQFRSDFTPIQTDCACYICTHYTKAYLAHLFRAKEMSAATLASIHNLYFLVNLTKQIRQSILDGGFPQLKEQFLLTYQKQ